MKRPSLILSIFILAFSAKAQINPSSVISGSLNDMQYLSEGYLSPFADALSYSMTNGWYNTAKVRKKFRFEISLVSSISVVPNEMKSFTVDANRLEALELVDPNNNISPTVFGDQSPGVALQYSHPQFGGLANSQFNLPQGIGMGVMPMIGIQGGVGLPMDFELKARFIPSSGVTFIKGSSVNQWGLALKHDLRRYFPKGKLLPFHLSAFVAYSSLNFNQELQPGSGNDKEISLSANTLLTRILISKKLLFLTFYGGLGYNYNAANISMLGTYDYIDPTNASNPEQQVMDPISFETNQSSGIAGNLGIRGKFLVIGMASLDYTFGNFRALTLNAGFSWDL